MKINNQLIIKLYSILLPFLPILGIYGLPYISKLTLADIILLVLVLLRMLINKGLVKLDFSLFCLMLYILIQPLLLSFYADSVSIDWGDTIGTSFRLAFNIAIYGIVFYNVAYESSVITSFRVLGCISIVYGIVQFIATNLFGIVLSTYIPFLHIFRADMDLDSQHTGALRYGRLARVNSWFSEPSTFSIFLLLALCIELMLTCDHKKEVSKFVYLYIVGIIISCSSTGFVGLLFLYILYALFVYKISKKRIIEVIFLILFFIFIAFKSGYIDFTLNHIFASGKGLQHQSHFSAISIIFQNKINFWEILFGHGMQQIVDNNMILYLPGWLRTFYYLGIFGVMLYILSFFTVSRKLNKNGKLIVLLFIFLNLGTEIMLGIFSILYMTIAMMERKIEPLC